MRLPEEMKERGEERGQCGEATCLDGLMALKWHLFLSLQLLMSHDVLLFNPTDILRLIYPLMNSLLINPGNLTQSTFLVTATFTEQ